MEYGFIIVSSILFFASLSLLALAFSKKPTKKHIKEIEEAGLEIANQIQEATEESLQKIENKINELERKVVFYEKEIQKATEKQQKIQVEVREKVKKEIQQVKKEVELPKFELQDEKAQEILQYHQKGMDVSQIAKKMGMFAGVVQIYINFIKMNQEKVS